MCVYVCLSVVDFYERESILKLDDVLLFFARFCVRARRDYVRWGVQGSMSPKYPFLGPYVSLSLCVFLYVCVCVCA